MAADFVGGLRGEGGDHGRLALFIDGDHREEAAIGVADHLRPDVLGEDFDADFHRGIAGVVDRGQEGD